VPGSFPTWAALWPPAAGPRRPLDENAAKAVDSRLNLDQSYRIMSPPLEDAHEVEEKLCLISAFGTIVHRLVVSGDNSCGRMDRPASEDARPSANTTSCGNSGRSIPAGLLSTQKKGLR
jgi:hypothetical protein